MYPFTGITALACCIIHLTTISFNLHENSQHNNNIVTATTRVILSYVLYHLKLLTITNQPPSYI